MYAQQQQQQQQQRPPRRIRWTEDKQYMTAQDVDYIVKMSEYQLQSDNPYIEDFYSLQYSLRSPQVKPTISKTALRVIREHRPIALVWRPANGTGRRGENPFQGALGRIPGHSIRAPRTLVELQKLSDEKALLPSSINFTPPALEFSLNLLCKAHFSFRVSIGGRSREFGRRGDRACDDGGYRGPDLACAHHSPVD